MDFELTDEQRLIQETVRDFVDARVLPNAVENDINHHLDLGVIEGMAELGLLGIVIPEEYGGAGLDFVAEALSCEEIERGEAAFRTLISVHVGLNSLSLLRYANEEQKQRYLVPQARGEKLACFGLTEPDSGSNPGSMRTSARRDGDDWILNGAKMWITNGTIADLAVVWARTDEGEIRGFLVEKGMPGFSAPEIHKKLSLRASITSELVLQDVRVPADSMLPGSSTLRGPLSCLNEARFGIVFGAVGAARACFEELGIDEPKPAT